jgi:hypothetical protein
MVTEISQRQPSMPETFLEMEIAVNTAPCRHQDLPLIPVSEVCCKPLRRSARTHTQDGGDFTSESKRKKRLRGANKSGAPSETSAVRLINLLHSARRQNRGSIYEHTSVCKLCLKKIRAGTEYCNSVNRTRNVRTC